MTDTVFVSMIRHGTTEGNKLRRYIGSTDEPLCREGILELEKKSMPHAQLWAVSPLKRCVQTCRILMSRCAAENLPVLTVPDFRECNFGLFENKNYLEMKDLPAYQAWIDSGGGAAFPGGESPEAFRERSCRAFKALLERCFADDILSVNLVVHGGTVMSVLDGFCCEKERGGRTYYDWYVPNGCGYSALAELTVDGIPVLSHIVQKNYDQVTEKE